MASSLDREVEKPGFSSWVFHRLIENCSTETGGLIFTNGKSLAWFRVVFVVVLVFWGGIFFSLNDYRNLDFY